MITSQTSTIAVTIDAPFREVAIGLADPMKHPEWGTEFFDGPATDIGDGVVTVNVPMMGGPARMKIDADIDRGIIDIFLAPGDTPFGNPLPVRLVPNGQGVDVLWTLARPKGMPDTVWDRSLNSMAVELANLKDLFEAKTG